jgi:hypothetical protein
MDDIIGGRAAGPRGERATGTPNTIYDLSSVLFHALEGGASYDTYIEDAEREGDQELAEFFRQVRDEDSNRADRAQQLLAERTSTAERIERTTGAVSGTEAGPPGRAERSALGREDRLPREERGALGREDRLPREGRGALGREDRLPREGRGALGREDRLPREERGALGREDRLPREERAGETAREEDKGLSGRGDEEGRREEERRER